MAKELLVEELFDDNEATDTATEPDERHMGSSGSGTSVLPFPKKRHGKANREPGPTSNGSFEAYMREVARHPLLSRERERALTTTYFETRDRGVFETLLRSNLRFVVKIAMRYQRYAVPIMDLIQEGNLGLMRAIEKFEPARNIRLSSYAAFWIKAYITDFLISNVSIVKGLTTRGTRKAFYAAGRTENRLYSELGREPSDKEIADSLGVSVEDLQTASAVRTYASLDTPIGDDGDDSMRLLDVLASGMKSPEEHAVERDIWGRRLDLFRAAFETLPVREGEILRLRHLEDRTETLQEIGERLGISRERVRQLEVRALGEVKRKVKASE